MLALTSRFTTASKRATASVFRSLRATSSCRQGASSRETFTVRKISFGVGVERTFPVYSPKVEKIEVVRHGAVRRAKLYYLRDKVGKAARIREKGF